MVTAMSKLTHFAVVVQVATTKPLTADQVHEALCRYLHEECISFVHDGCTIEFTNVADPLQFEPDE